MEYQDTESWELSSFMQVGRYLGFFTFVLQGFIFVKEQSNAILK